MEKLFLFLPDDDDDEEEEEEEERPLDVEVWGCGGGWEVVGFFVRRPFFPTSVHPLESAIVEAW